MTGSRLLIVGASVRAVAASARRAGFRPVAIDMFGDADLPAESPDAATAWRSGAIATAAARFPEAPWMYCGGMEHRPALVRRLSRGRNLLGASPEVLRRVCDPLVVQDARLAAGLPFPTTVAASQGLPRDGSWLAKRRRSAGGMHVRPLDARFDARSEQGRTSRATWNYQRRILGESWGAAYLGDGSRAELFGVTLQTAAPDVLADRPFLYGGSIGPLSPTTAEREHLRRLGGLAAATFALQGLFGIDVVVDARGRLWTVEINPRYTASLELLERAGDVHVVALHMSACTRGELPSRDPIESSLYYGKRIVYARRDGEVSELLSGAWLAEALVEPWPNLADVPRGGSKIEAGQPLATVFASGATTDEVADALRLRSDRVQAEFATGVASARRA